MHMQTTYVERDAEDYQGSVLTQEAGLQAAYRAMHLTERATVVTAATEPSWSLQLASAQEQVAAFLRDRGLPSSVRPPLRPPLHPSLPAQHLVGCANNRHVLLPTGVCTYCSPVQVSTRQMGAAL